MITYTALKNCAKVKPDYLLPMIEALTESDANYLKEQGISAIDVKKVAKRALNDIQIAIVAKDGDKLVGMISVASYDKQLVNLLYVDPEYRRQGIAGKLMASLSAFTRSNYKVNVVKGNDSAKGFYKSLGMKEISTLMMVHD